MRFGLFDWLDDTGRDLADTYAQRLEMVQLADRLGYYCYHVAEHHATPLSMVPSPNLFLAAASQRTSQLRLGVLAYLLPFYQPLRLLEEICMMDQLSRGRLEVGLSRGASQFEMASYGVTAAQSRGMFNEAMELILMGLSTGKIDYHGRYYTYEDVQTRLRPFQKPYPPLWYPTSNIDSIPYIGSQGLSAVFALHLAPSLDAVWHMLARYRESYEAHRDEPKRINRHVPIPNYGFSVHVHVADTDAQAVKQARESWKHFFESFAYLWVQHGMGDRYANRSDFDQLLEEGKMLVGSPATVRERLKAHMQAAGGNYMIGSFSWGNFTPEQVLTSVDLFAREVIPHL